MTEFPYMQLYVSDYLADTAYLNAQEHGGYLLLMMNYWQVGTLPNDDRKLARIARMTDQEWADCKATILEFFQVQEDRLTHKRIEADLQEAREKVAKAALAGRASGEARRRKPVQHQFNGRPTEGELPFDGRSTGDEQALNTRSTDVEQTVNHSDSESYPDSDSEPEEQTPPNPPPGGGEGQVPHVLNHRRRAIGPKLAEFIELWNAAGLPPERSLVVNIPKSGEATQALAAWSPEEVAEALGNYADLLKHRADYRRVWPEYGSPATFAIAGIRQYLTASDPWGRCGRKVPAGEAPDDALAEYRRRKEGA